MKIGIAIAPLFRYFEDFQEILELLVAKELDFNLIEIHTNFIDDYLLYLLKLSERFNIAYTVHIPHLYDKEKVNFCSANKSDIKKAEFWLNKSIKIAKQLKSKFITIHPDPSKNCSKEKAKEILYEHIKSGLKQLNKNQKILIENMPSLEYTLADPKEIKEFIKKFKTNQVACTWDVTHAKIAINKRYIDFPKILKNKIKEVHISDIKNNKDHLPLKKGNLNISKIIKALKDINYKGNIILEICTDNIKDIENSLSILDKNINKN